MANSPPRWQIGILVVFVVFCAYRLSKWNGSSRKTQTSDTAATEARRREAAAKLSVQPLPPHLVRGQEIIISGDQNNWIAVDSAAWSEAYKASTAGDKHGLYELIVAGRLFVVDDGTPGLLLSIGMQQHEVRILDGPQTGKKGWIDTKLVHPR